MCSKRWLSTFSFPVLIVLVCPLLMIWQTGQAYADSPIMDLQIDSPETIRWEIGNIKPGDSGLEPVTLRNTGNATGYLLVWIAELVDDEGANPESEMGNTANPGELSSFIYLDIINNGMTFARLTNNGYVYVNLPITLKSFPGSSDRALYIANAQIDAGQTLELQWQWTLSPYAGNVVQGDTVSFSIYYALVSHKPAKHVVNSPSSDSSGAGDDTTPEPTPEPTTEPSPEPAPPPPPTSEVSDNETPEPTPPIAARRYASADGRCVIYIPEGEHVMTGSGQELLNIIIDTPGDTPPAPGPFGFASPVYQIRCYTLDGMSQGTELKPGVQLIIYIGAEMMAENAEISIYSYHPGSGWVRLDCITDPSGGWLTARVEYLDIVAVLALPKDNGVTYLEPTTPASDLTPGTGVVSGVRKMFTQVSIAVALAGTIAMIVLAYLQRQRRIRQAGHIE